jgi:hypothetical protein
VAGTTGAIITCPLEVVKTRFQANQGGGAGAGGGGGGAGLTPTARSTTASSSLNNHNNVHNTASSNKTSQKLTNNSKLTTRLKCYSNILLRNNHFSHSTAVPPPVTTRDLMANLFKFEPNVKQTHRHIFPTFTKQPLTRPDHISIYSQFK